MQSMIILVWHIKVAQFLMTIWKDNLGLLCEIVISSSLDSLCSNLSLKVTSKDFNIQFLCLKTLRPMVCLEKNQSVIHFREMVEDVARI